MAITMALTALGTPGTTEDVWEANGHYLMVDDEGRLTMWTESNSRPGLQDTPVTVLGEVALAPDTRLHL